MAEIYFDVDVALSEVPVNIFPLTDDTDFKTRETGITYDQAGMDLVWNFVTTAGSYTQTAVTPTTSGVYDWTNQGDGMYSIEIPASSGASINNDTEGFGWFTGICTGVLPWRSPIFGFRAAGINDKLIDSAYDVARGLAGTALPAAAADAAGGLTISDAGGLDLDTQLGKLIGTLATGTHNPQSGDSYSIVTNATYGNSALENLVDDIETALANGTYGLNALLTAINTRLATSGYTIPPTVVQIRQEMDSNSSKLDVSVSTRSSHTAADVWSVTIRTLTNYGSLVSDIATAIWGAVTRTITGGTVDTCTTNTDMRGTDNALLASGYTAPPSVSSIADAVWDEATSGHSGAGTTGLALTSASAPTAEQVADAVWDESVSGHTTGGSTGATIIAAGSAGDPWSTLIPGAYGAGTAGKIVGDNINATISSRSSHSAADVWSVSVRTLSSFGTLVVDIATAVWSATTRTLSAFGFTVAPTVADIRTEIDSNSTQLIAIKAKTDQLTFTVAGHVDSTASITGGGDATEAHQLDMIDKLKGLMSKAHVLTTAVGTFTPATDSNEAIRDRGDVAWNNGSINTMASTRSNTSATSSDAIIQDCAYKDISFKSGDDFEFDLDFPMDITAYTITAVVDGVSFTVTKKTTVRVGFSLTAAQTATLRDNFPWSLTLLNAGKTRKYITGKYIKI